MNSSRLWVERFQWSLLLVLGISLATWVALTPPGLLGKADAIGYAVCHRISERSFFLDDRALPLCSRCSGMYLGALASLIYHFARGRRGQLPARKIQVVLGLFLVFFAFDGVNSFLTFFPGAPNVYVPLNELRLLSGTLVGVGMAALLAPTFTQVVWHNWQDRAALGGYRHLALVVAAAGLIAAAIRSENPLLVYPLALLSVISLLTILVLAYTILWVMLFRRENAFLRWRQLLPYLWLAMLTTLLQIAAVDGVRLWLTGTWGGFTL